MHFSKTILSLPIALIVGLILFLTLGNKPPVVEDDFRWYTMEEVIKIKENNPQDTKGVFVDVYTDWCGWCKRMDATTFKDEQVRKALSTYFYPVKFDGEQKEDVELKGRTFKFVAKGRRGYHELAAEMLQGRLSYPTVVLLDKDMNMIQPIPGYRTAKDLLPILEYIGQKAYQSQPWEEFLAEWNAAG